MPSFLSAIRQTTLRLDTTVIFLLGGSDAILAHPDSPLFGSAHQL